MLPAAKTTVEKRDIYVVTLGEVGPRGAQGPAGPAGASVEQFVAAEALGGHRAVKIDANGQAAYASNTDAASSSAFLGVTTGAAVMLDLVSVQRAGAMTEGTWNWVVGQPVFLGTNGLLTQTPPAAPAFSLVVGFATAPTTLFIAPREPVALS